MVQPLWKTVWQGFKNLNIELPDDPAILLLCRHPKEVKVENGTDICAPLLTVAQRW
jgi:hypothetical protein